MTEAAVVVLYLCGGLLTVLVAARHWPDEVLDSGGCWVFLAALWPLLVPAGLLFLGARRFERAMRWYVGMEVPPPREDG